MNTYLYRPEAPEVDEFDDDGDIVEKAPEDADPFHIGQGYESQPAKQLRCVKCRGTVFHVAQGDYYTAIRCVSCRWETQIHEG